MTNEACSGASNPSNDPNSEKDHFKSLANQLAEENARLKQELERTRIDRDDYLRALRYYAPGQFFTETDLAEFRKNSVSGREMLREIEEMMRESP